MLSTPPKENKPLNQSERKLGKKENRAPLPSRNNARKAKNYFLVLFTLVTTCVRDKRRAFATVVNLPVMAERPRSSFLGVAIIASYI